MSRLLEADPNVLTEQLLAHGGRAYLIWDHQAQRVVASAPWLAEIAEWLAADQRDFHSHEGLFFAVGPETGALFGAFVHKTVRGQAAGGLRHWPYPCVEAMVRDGLRLSMGMSRKNALAGLWWGGGKGIIARQPGDRYRDPDYRRTLYREYGEFTTSLRGVYITAEDVGTTPEDVAAVFETTRFAISVPPAVGGSGNPSPATARGVVCAMEGALDYRNAGMFLEPASRQVRRHSPPPLHPEPSRDAGTLAGKTVAMQGAGNVATFMIEELLARDIGRVIATEISPERCAMLRDRFAGKPVEIRQSSPDDLSIFAEPCDVFAPCALGGVLRPETIPMIAAPIVCGAANNQLLDDRRDDQALAERGILYVPDFVANRMGIVNCANEQYGIVPDDPAINRHFSRDWDNAVFVVTKRILELAKREGITTSDAANKLADEACQQPHPMWGHRGRAIIEGLRATGWAG